MFSIAKTSVTELKRGFESRYKSVQRLFTLFRLDAENGPEQTLKCVTSWKRYHQILWETLSMLCVFDCIYYFSPHFADSDSGSAFPATARAAECHGLHQQGSQPSGPHRYRWRHQRRYRKTARLSAFLIPSTESVRRETRSKHSPHHIKSDKPHIDRISITQIVFFFFFFASINLWIKKQWGFQICFLEQHKTNQNRCGMTSL